MAMFFGSISEKNNIETVIRTGNEYAAIPSTENNIANWEPARVAPNVFAIVFAVRIEDVVLSISAIRFSNITPRFWDIFFRAIISKPLVPRTMASNMEHTDDMARVKNTVTAKNIILIAARYTIDRKSQQYNWTILILGARQKPRKPNKKG